jgi:hypothetical protein
MERKYPSAEKGFACGIESPVPLAQPHVNIGTIKTPVYSRWLRYFKRLERVDETSFEYIGFTDGVTRTMWLIENGVEVFPVECRIEEAAKMQRAVGVAGGDYKTVEDLVPTEL